MRLVRAAVIHRIAEETGHPERFNLRFNFFQVTPKGFLTLVDAADHLKARRRGRRRRIRRVQ